MTIECPKCGLANPASATQCDCGQPISGMFHSKTLDPGAGIESRAVPETDQPGKPRSHRKKKLLRVVLLIPGFLVATLIAFAFFAEGYHLVAHPEQVADYRFGSETMVGHGGWTYTNARIYTFATFAAGILFALCAVFFWWPRLRLRWSTLALPYAVLLAAFVLHKVSLRLPIDLPRDSEVAVVPRSDHPPIALVLDAAQPVSEPDPSPNVAVTLEASERFLLGTWFFQTPGEPLILDDHLVFNADGTFELAQLGSPAHTGTWSLAGSTIRFRGTMEDPNDGTQTNTDWTIEILDRMDGDRRLEIRRANGAPKWLVKR